MARRLIGLVALLLVLAGCGGDPKAEPAPAPSTSPVSTTPSAPAMPDAAKENSKAGAVAFVRHYIELINYAQSTGDVSALRAVEDPGCGSCANGRHALEGIFQAGGSIQGGALALRVLSTAPSPRYRGWLVTGTLRFAPESVVRKPGKPPQQLRGGSIPANAFVSMNNEVHEWRVMDWTRGS